MNLSKLLELDQKLLKLSLKKPDVLGSLV